MRKSKDQRLQSGKTKLMDIDSVFTPRQKCRGIFLASRWSFEKGNLTLSYSPVRNRYPWNISRSRFPRFYTRHGTAGENRTNNCSSKTRQGSAAEQRHLKSLATPTLCFRQYFCREKSDEGGGSDVRLHGATAYRRAVSCFITSNAGRQRWRFFICEELSGGCNGK